MTLTAYNERSRTGVITSRRPLHNMLEHVMHTDSTDTTRVGEIWAAAELIEASKAGVELWRPVKDTDGWYDVSNLGRIRSWIPAGGRKAGRLETPNIITACKNRERWPYPCVTVMVGTRRRYVAVSNLVCEAFIGPRPEPRSRWEAAHHDGDTSNNRLDNLKWAEKLVNAQDRHRHGRDHVRPSLIIDGVLHYSCTGCFEWLPESAFDKLSSRLQSKCGLKSRCRPCSRIQARELKRSSRERKKAAA